MVRKATELKSIEDLGLPPRTNTMLWNKDYTPADAVQLGRSCYHISKSASSRPKWQTDLMIALDKEGFIRHDLNGSSFGIVSLYMAAYDIEYNGPYRDMLLFTNEFYERMHDASQEELDAIRIFLHENLEWKEAETIRLHFKLFDGTSWSVANIANYINENTNQVALIEGIAIQKIHRKVALLPKISLG